MQAAILTPAPRYYVPWWWACCLSAVARCPSWLLLHQIPFPVAESCCGPDRLRTAACLPCRPPSLHLPEHPHCAQTHAADARYGQIPVESVRPRVRLAGPSRQAGLLALGPRCMGRPHRPLAGSFPTRSVWTRPDVSAAHPAFFSNRRCLQGLPHKQAI